MHHYILDIELNNGEYAITDGYLTDDYETVNTFNNPIKPEKIIFQNNYATIVYWNDGTKTVVKKSENDEFIPEVGFAMALLKRVYGNRSEVLRWIENAEIKE